MQRYRTKIGGVPVETRDVAVVKSPFDGQTVAEVGLGSAADIQAAIASATLCFGTMRHAATHERARLLHGIAAGIGAREGEFATLIARESGKPIRYARGEVRRAVTTFLLAAAAVRTAHGDEIPIDQQPGQEGRICISRRAPRGPVAAISPFNFPLNLVAHKLAPALAIGAPVVLKPAAQAPLTAHLLSDVVDAAGAPPGAFSVVHCLPEVAEQLVDDERMKVLSFTGSDALGFRLKARVPKKQVILELGGNAPCIVDEGVELERAMPKILESAWANAGQICIKAQRIFVVAPSFDAFLARFVEASGALAVGDPLDEATVVGPMIEARHVERVLSWVNEARAAGAQVLCGGRAAGAVVPPTVLTGTRADMRVRELEVFGPVTVVERADSFEHALALANEGRYGLQASVFTPRLDRALEAYRTLDFGAVLINDPTSFRVDNYPYGGTKDSGFGREGILAAMEELSEPKVLILNSLS